MTISKDEIKIIEKIKDAMNQEGSKILINDIKTHLDSQNTLKITPILGDKGQVLSSTSDEMIKRLGYVLALEWVLWTIDYYQNFQEDRDEV